VERAANNQIGNLPAMAAELVGQGVQAICAVGPVAVRAAREATSSVPIVAMDLESDAVANGWASVVTLTLVSLGRLFRGFRLRTWSR
jgi:putative ABC transport system substrate-binding protein